MSVDRWDADDDFADHDVPLWDEDSGAFTVVLTLALAAVTVEVREASGVVREVVGDCKDYDWDVTILEAGWIDGYVVRGEDFAVWLAAEWEDTDAWRFCEESDKL